MDKEVAMMDCYASRFPEYIWSFSNIVVDSY